MAPDELIRILHATYVGPHEGVTDAELLDHCRGDGPHVRGCWVCDLVLGKE